MQFEFRGINFAFGDTVQGQQIAAEVFADNYRIFERGLEFRPGDIVLDVGANEGMFAIMIAKCFPQVRVIALEPVPTTFLQLVRNITMNGVNIDAHNVGVAGEKKRMELVVDKKGTTGGASGIQTYDPVFSDLTVCDFRPLDEFLQQRVRLLKIDIEGMEYEALYASKLLKNVDYCVGEFHTNQKLKLKYEINELATWVGSQTNLIFFDRCHMAE
jgi:FkbM family methyltransferase